MPPMPVYVDSPLTVKLTDVFKLHPDCYDEDARAMLAGGDSPFEFDGLDYITERGRLARPSTPPTSPRSSSAPAACARAAASSTTSSRRSTDPKNTVVIVGFQAQHTLGRRLVERRTARPHLRRRARAARRGGGAQRLLRPRRPGGPARLRRRRARAGPAPRRRAGPRRARRPGRAPLAARPTGASPRSTFLPGARPSGSDHVPGVLLRSPHERTEPAGPLRTGQSLLRMRACERQGPAHQELRAG